MESMDESGKIEFYDISHKAKEESISRRNLYIGIASIFFAMIALFLVFGLVMLFEFVAVLIVVYFFGRGSYTISTKLIKALIISVCIVVIGFLGSLFGIIGLLLTFFVKLIIVKIVLGYDMLGAFFFLVLLDVVNVLIFFSIGMLIAK